MDHQLIIIIHRRNVGNLLSSQKEEATVTGHTSSMKLIIQLLRSQIGLKL